MEGHGEDRIDFKGDFVTVEDTENLRERVIRDAENEIKVKTLAILNEKVDRLRGQIKNTQAALDEILAKINDPGGSKKSPKALPVSVRRLKEKLANLKEREGELVARLDPREEHEEIIGDILTSKRENDNGNSDGACNESLSKGGEILDDESDNRNKFIEISTEDQDNDDGDDDGDDEIYSRRMEKLKSNRNEEEIIRLRDEYKIAASIYYKLFPYQRVCINWLWELHCQDKGGIIGDEMGLGKTIQVIGFLSGLDASNLIKLPTIIVCPTTVLGQWIREFHRWWPKFRICVVHSTGTAFKNHSTNMESDTVDQYINDAKTKGLNHHDEIKRFHPKKARGTNHTKGSQAIKEIYDKADVILTTYGIVRQSPSILLEFPWGYAILDEGHQIRNPDAETTISCKKLKTKHRIILTGTPIQNNLTELWSLYDFSIPGILGTLPLFKQKFTIPISLGGYVGATRAQIQTASKCAKALKEIISPYLILRVKADVAKQLPPKTEKILFCRLTPLQKSMYEKFLAEEVDRILDGRRNALYGIDILRKICNHSDILERGAKDQIKDYGHFSKSGKMIVLDKILKVWYKLGNRVLIFCQTQQMLDILELYVKGEKYKYFRMDGSTPVQYRASIINEFNSNSSTFIFLLSTRVGGLGLNLIGANCVVVYDPDWNPSTDIQAQERSWRIGQKKKVTIYRLLTAGTVEEKVYHKQIFKQFLANKVLKTPLQEKLFRANDLINIFSLDWNESTTETQQMFDNPESNTENDSTIRQENVVCTENINKTDKQSNYGESKADDTEDLDEESRMFSLFLSSGSLQTMFQHDKVFKPQYTGNDILEQESTRVAKEASDAIKLGYRKLRKYTDDFRPTWTGYSGEAGKPVEKEYADSEYTDTKSERVHRLLHTVYEKQEANKKARVSNTEAEQLDRKHMPQIGKPYSQSIHSEESLVSGSSKNSFMAPSQILRTMRQKCNLAFGGDHFNSEKRTHSRNDRSEDYEEIKKRLRSCFSPFTGTCTTSDIIRITGTNLSPTKKMFIRKSLREIAFFERPQNIAHHLQGKWILRDFKK